MARHFQPIALDPELEMLLEAAKLAPPMTPSQKREQRISFAYGQLPEGNTRTREDIARLHDEIYGVPR